MPSSPGLLLLLIWGCGLYSMYWLAQSAERFCSCRTEPPDSWGRLEPRRPQLLSKLSSDDSLKMKPVGHEVIRTRLHLGMFSSMFTPWVLLNSSSPHHWVGFGGRHRGFPGCLCPHSGPPHRPELTPELSTSHRKNTYSQLKTQSYCTVRQVNSIQLKSCFIILLWPASCWHLPPSGWNVLRWGRALGHWKKEPVS